jgi:hypothetical protein
VTCVSALPRTTATNPWDHSTPYIFTVDLLPLFLQDAVLAAQATQFVMLLGGQPILPFTGIESCLLDPFLSADRQGGMTSSQGTHHGDRRGDSERSDCGDA